MRRRRLIRVVHRVVFGTRERINQVLAAHGWQINTAFVEVRSVGRKRTEVLGQTVQPKAVQLSFHEGASPSLQVQE